MADQEGCNTNTIRSSHSSVIGYENGTEARCTLKEAHDIARAIRRANVPTDKFSFLRPHTG